MLLGEADGVFVHSPLFYQSLGKAKDIKKETLE
jgi:hypothetical protein